MGFKPDRATKATARINCMAIEAREIYHPTAKDERRTDLSTLNDEKQLKLSNSKAERNNTSSVHSLRTFKIVERGKMVGAQSRFHEMSAPIYGFCSVV